MKNNENSKNLIKICLLLLGICMVFSLGINTTSAANTTNIYVNSHGNDTWNGLNATWIKGTLNGPKATIKNATATVKTGGTVYIADGTYNENNIQIKTDMTIIGANQKNTVINGGKQAGLPETIFTILAGVKITMNDLTIENGYNGHIGTDNGLGGAISNKGTLTVNAITFTDNSASEYGGAIYNEGNLNVNSCTFNNNIVTDDINSGCNGGAIYNLDKLTVTGSAFNNDTSTNDGGAIFNNALGRLIINESGFTQDTSSENGYGGAIGSDGSSTITDSIFTLNSAAPGGAIGNMGNMSITSCIFKNNSATEFGGALINAGNLNITSSNFNNNNANKGNGGALGNLGQLTLQNNNIFTENLANNGGAIFNAYNLTITKNNTFNSNIATTTGGAIYNTIFDMNGQNFVGDTIIESSTFKANKAAYGGAIENEGTLTVKTSTFTYNTASNGDGGAIYSVNDLILSGNTFINNTASNGDGGAIAYEPGASIESSAPAAPAVPAVPAAPAKAATAPMTVVVNAAAAKKEDNDVITASITGCTFSYNMAKDGGAIFSDGNIIIKNCTFIDNTASNGNGGAIAYEPEASSEPVGPSPPAKAKAAAMTVSAKAIAAPKAVEVYATSAPAAPAAQTNSINASIISCKFIDNTALNGGAIENDGNMTVANCIFTNDTANYGGAIFSDDNLSITCSTFESNSVSMGEGGAIYNGPYPKAKAVATTKAKSMSSEANISNISTDIGPYLKIDESSFVNNNAINGDGGAIATTGDANINFSRIIGNNAINGSAIYNSGDLMNASLNWWGSNMDPSSNVFGNVTVTPWLILKITANPNIIKNGASQVTAVLLYDSNGVYHDPANGKLPDGIPVTFTGSDGTFNPTSGILVDGQAKSLFTANAKGETSVSTTIDNQTVSITITSDPTLTNETNTINNNSKNLKISNTTIPMQHTGLPIAGLILAILTVIGGTIIPRKR